ncbi:MAG: LysM peptidoglycan-binding domain-containing protein [Sciscionella sp.]
MRTVPIGVVSVPWPPSDASPPPLRLTHRGRVAVFIVVFAAALTALSLLGSPAASTGSAHQIHDRTVIVQSGQTLWQVAGEVAPGQDPRPIVDKIMELNSLSDPGAIRPGEPLYLPTGS